MNNLAQKSFSPTEIVLRRQLMDEPNCKGFFRWVHLAVGKRGLHLDFISIIISGE
jgi:hypothetical protein